jgi:hypothetical protein
LALGLLSIKSTVWVEELDYKFDFISKSVEADYFEVNSKLSLPQFTGDRTQFFEKLVSDKNATSETEQLLVDVARVFIKVEQNQDVAPAERTAATILFQMPSVFRWNTLFTTKAKSKSDKLSFF